MRVAKVLLTDPDGNVLILYRSATHPSHAHEADLPGGIIEDGEDFAEGLAREIREETGLLVEPASLLLINETNRIGRSHKRLYRAKLDERPIITISWEHERYE